jgi:hypothetical protein
MFGRVHGAPETQVEGLHDPLAQNPPEQATPSGRVMTATQEALSPVQEVRPP